MVHINVQVVVKRMLTLRIETNLHSQMQSNIHYAHTNAERPYARVNKASASSRVNLVLIGYWGLCAICMMNLNGITALMFGMTRLMSIGILVFGLMILTMARCGIVDSLGRTGVMFIGFIAIYLSLGCIGNLEFDLLVSHLNTAFIVMSSSVGAKSVATTYGLRYALRPLVVFAFLGAVSVFMSPLLLPYYKLIRNAELVANAGRWLGFFANPNETGMASVISLACCLILSMVSASTIINRILTVASCITLGAAVFLTFSRGAMLTFFVVGALFLLLTATFNARSVQFFFVAAVLLMFSYWFFVFGYKSLEWSNEQRVRIVSFERMLTGESISERDSGGRLNGISAGLEYWEKSPVIGHGLGSMHRMPGEYFGGLGCHNTHVMVLGEVGIVGFAFYLMWMLSYLHSATRIKYLPARVFCSLTIAIFVLYGMVSHNVLDQRGMNCFIGVGFCFLGLYTRRAVEITWPNQQGTSILHPKHFSSGGFTSE